MHAKLRIDLAQNMDMIWHDFHLSNRYLPFSRHFLDDALESLVNGRPQDRSSILGTPNHMIVARVDHVAIGSVLRQYAGFIP